jgi:hypothetical protein
VAVCPKCRQLTTNREAVETVEIIVEDMCKEHPLLCDDYSRAVVLMQPSGSVRSGVFG